MTKPRAGPTIWPLSLDTLRFADDLPKVGYAGLQAPWRSRISLTRGKARGHIFVVITGGHIRSLGLNATCAVKMPGFRSLLGQAHLG